MRAFGAVGTPDDVLSGPITRRAQLSEAVRRALNELTISTDPGAGTALARLGREPTLSAWRSHLVHGREMHARALRDSTFEYPKPDAILAALEGRGPASAADLRAILLEELSRLRDELHASDTTPWKRYWNVDSDGKPTEPRAENECRDHLLDRLRDRLQRYGISVVLPEARRAENKRADTLVLTATGRNLPIEIKRHYNRHLWTTPTTQLQPYARTEGADERGIYLVLWFGVADGRRIPTRPDGRDGPTSASEMEVMLKDDLAAEGLTRLDVLVFDASAPTKRQLDTTSAETQHDRR